MVMRFKNDAKVGVGGLAILTGTLVSLLALSSGSASAVSHSLLTPAQVPSHAVPRLSTGISQALADRTDQFVSRPSATTINPLAIPSGAWQPLGPAPIGPPFLAGGGFYGGVNSGRVTATVVLPSGPLAGRVVIGTAGGGIWTSDNKGSTWTARSDTAASLAIGSVAIDPSNPNHL